MIFCEEKFLRWKFNRTERDFLSGIDVFCGCAEFLLGLCQKIRARWFWMLFTRHQRLSRANSCQSTSWVLRKSFCGRHFMANWSRSGKKCSERLPLWYNDTFAVISAGKSIMLNRALPSRFNRIIAVISSGEYCGYTERENYQTNWIFIQLFLFLLICREMFQF